MECPEVWSFAEPEPLIQIEEYTKLPEEKFNKFPFGHLVTVIIPNAPKIDLTFTERFCKEWYYYKVADFEPLLLLDKTFLSGFVRNGQLAIISIESRIDCDDCMALLPNGKLILRLSKDSYEELSLQGKLSQFYTRIGDPYIVSINLKDAFIDPERSSTQKLQEVVSKLGCFKVILTWKPPSEDICPSSVAKYLNKKGYTISVCNPEFQPHCIFTNMMPLFKSEYTSVNKDDHDSVAEFLEWLGMVSVSGDLNENGEGESYVSTFEPPITCVLSDPTQILRFRGFFMPEDILKLVRYFKDFNSIEKKPWIAIYVQGFSDSPVGWNFEEHQYYLNGDNGYVVIFNEEKTMLVSFGCSRKRLK